MEEGKDVLGRLERGVMMCRGAFEENGTYPLTDDKYEVTLVCEAIEEVLRYRIRDDHTSYFGENKDYWNFISESLDRGSESTGLDLVTRAITAVNILTHLETPLGKGRALIRWGLMYKRLAEIVQFALEDFQHVNDWYMVESVILEDGYSTQFLQFLLDLQEIQFHLPSHGQDLDTHWPTKNGPINVIVNGGLRPSFSDMPPRPTTPIPKGNLDDDYPVLQSDKAQCRIESDFHSSTLSIPSEIRLVSSTLQDLRLLITSMNEKATQIDVQPPLHSNNRRMTMSNISLDSKPRSQFRHGSVTGVETVSKLDRLEIILGRLAEKEDTRDEISMLERSKNELEDELRKCKNKCLDYQLQLTETLNASETSDAELLQELGELQVALRQSQDTEHQTASLCRQFEQQLNEREVEFEINQELLLQADSERNDLKERWIYLQEDLDERCLQVEELTDELSRALAENEVAESTEVEQLIGSSNTHEKSEFILSLQDSLNEKESELTRSRREYQQMNTVVHAMKDERTRLQKECLELRALIPSLEKKVKERDGKIAHLEGNMSKLQQLEEVKVEHEHLKSKYRDLQLSSNKLQADDSEQKSALEFKLSSQRIELDNIKTKLASSQSHVNSLQSELEDVKFKLNEMGNELISNRADLKSREVEVESYRSEISGLKEMSLNYNISSNVDSERARREQSELTEQFAILQDENNTLRDTILKFTNQKLALFNRADELEHELEKLFLARWVEDSGVRHCPICHKVFTNSLRKHHCRLCGKVFCSDCTRSKIQTPVVKESVRCCIPCADFRQKFLASPHTSKDILNNYFSDDKKVDSDSFLSIASLGDYQEVTFDDSRINKSGFSSFSRSSFDLKSTGSESFSSLDNIKVNSISSTLPRETPYECLVGDYSEIIVHPKCAHCEDVIVSSGMTIVWEFVTERPIQFRLTYRSSAIAGVDCKETDIIPFTSYNSNTQDLPHIGHYTTVKGGVYRLVFSNETSILQSRKISYKVKLTNCVK